jgi:hypothetical protein
MLPVGSGSGMRNGQSALDCGLFRALWLLCCWAPELLERAGPGPFRQHG